MAENSSIEWTDHTANFWWGCFKVSPGCTNCYAETLSNRYGKSIWGPPKTTGRELKRGIWKDLPKWNRQAQESGRRKRVFVQSMADFFEDHEQVEEWRRAAITLIEDCTWLDFQVLTKRPENVLKMIPYIWVDMNIWPSHIWIGTSVENKDNLWRVDEIRKVPAAVRFLSLEPLLGDLGRLDLTGIHWVIAGGESGPRARPMHPEWARSLRDQCVAAGVPFFFKQWGAWSLIQKDTPIIHNGIDTGLLHDARRNTDFGCLDPDGTWYHQHTGWNGRPIDPDTGEAYMVKVGKKAAGRLLDGREWNEFPTTYHQSQPGEP